MLKIDQIAPLDVKVLNQSGETTSLRSLLGKYIVLYFYPKDNTPGCTVEACGFRDVNQEITKMGATVIGISNDSEDTHNKFSEKHQLNFPLWSDQEHTLLEAFGAWGEKNRFGKLYMGIIRSTFIIDPSGKIIKTWEKVKPENHPEEVLTFLKEYLKK
ncbi:MAG: thioredoxin-dependent thiol peroxidase [Candidatus Pacebacteria bacterium CG10_big_fil_rev_8_21_14_0_10_36_11]|nr:thioredoxin-dependent thiol peroxidase [Candidatus Pacearchaeota archaeon]OIP73628.1 MAG: peroxiredoxin [Candidatus Pacebacteria bacterium CG2_30_36_39]PIR64791.1 MAG: thioredoxin-dependent thiol peroxidase [Candidatus Pacebacteria bacterium CG10_big_fil_rev_8_21_14_0_10_36_11]